MRIYLIGGEGFIGSAFLRLLTELGLRPHVITRSTWRDYEGSACDVLIDANGNSKKFLADQDPLMDFNANVQAVCRSLQDFRSDLYVLVSSGDVYPDQSRPELTREESHIDISRCSRYGLHKKLAEDLIRGVHNHWLIVRMGGVLGPGLKKNAVYDMLHDQPVWLHPNSVLQYLRTDTAARVIWRMVENGIKNEVVNVGGRGVVRLGSLHDRLGSHSEFKTDGPCIAYELSLEKLERLHGEDMPESTAEVDAFLQSIGR